MKIITFITLVTLSSVESIGEKAFEACKSFGESMLECQNILTPTRRVRVPIDLLMFPHMVLIGFGKNTTEHHKWKCGGTLISEKWVLTAAHCIEDPVEGPARLLRIGTANFKFDEVIELAQERIVAGMIIHPEYKSPSKYNDIALMRPNLRFILSRDIRIACLQRDDEVEGNVAAIQFSTTVSGAAFRSHTLMAVDVDIVPNEVCNKSMRAMIRRKIIKDGVTKDQLCAGDSEHGGRDACQGDSGCPLQTFPDKVDCVTTFPLHVVVGVTSFGRGCGRKMAPGVYTKVSRYIEWIESIIWP